MAGFSEIEATAVPLDRPEVDTDSIFPAEGFQKAQSEGFGVSLFAEWRRDPGFVLNRPEFAGAEVLVTGPAFGIGSSREEAVWALKEWGFKAVVAASFGQIFQRNCVDNALLPAVAAATDVARLCEQVAARPSTRVRLDIPNRTIETDDGSVGCALQIDELSARKLIEGVDDLALMLGHRQALAAVEARRERQLTRIRGAIDRLRRQEERA